MEDLEKGSGIIESLGPDPEGEKKKKKKVILARCKMRVDTWKPIQGIDPVCKDT